MEKLRRFFAGGGLEINVHDVFSGNDRCSAAHIAQFFMSCFKNDNGVILSYMLLKAISEGVKIIFRFPGVFAIIIQHRNRNPGNAAIKAETEESIPLIVLFIIPQVDAILITNRLRHEIPESGFILYMEIVRAGNTIVICHAHSSPSFDLSGTPGL